MSIGNKYFFSNAHTKHGDEMENTVWENGVIMPEFPPLNNDLKTDVLIVGGGMAGILCAYMLEQEGIDYTLIEADKICSGVTKNTTAKITSQHGLIYDSLIRQHGRKAARLYWEANEAAINEYEKLARSIACDFQRTDHFVYSKGDIKALAAEKTALDSLGIPSQWIKSLPLPFPVKGAICFPNQAQFHPLKFAAGIAKDLRIYEDTPAREFGYDRVVTDYGTITASKIIMATHFPLINKHGAYFLKLYQQRSYVLALKNAGNFHGMYLDGRENGLSFRNCEDLLLLGGGGHRTGKEGGGWVELERYAKRYFPQSQEVSRWATQDCMTLDGIPYIGRYGKYTTDLFVATGFNKWGMTSSMVAAMLLRDRVLGRKNPYADVFRPNRRILRKQLLVNTAEATVNLLTPTKPRCPHLGCALKWNKQEHTWDCPCHGSRFDEQGKLLDSPATGNLYNHEDEQRDE